MSGCLVLLVSLVEGHEQVLLHREGGLQATEEGILFLFGTQFTQEPYQGDSNSKQYENALYTKIRKELRSALRDDREARDGGWVGGRLVREGYTYTYS